MNARQMRATHTRAKKREQLEICDATIRPAAEASAKRVDVVGVVGPLCEMCEIRYNSPDQLDQLDQLAAT